MALETHIRLNARAGIAALTFAALAVLAPTREAAAATVFSVAGVDVAGVTPTVNAFRSALGSINPNVVGSFGTGRREINWDGVPDAFSAPNALPGNFFNVNSPRGVVFVTPGTGFQVSASSSSGTPTQFGNIDPSYPSIFEPFSPQRLFTALGSTIVDVNFFVPGTTGAALTRGFGAVFSDVDLANTTSLTFFGPNNELLGTFFAAAISGNETFSFLGVDFGSSQVSRVRITSGNVLLGAGQLDPDVVVMDDFIFGEPSNTPLPAALPLFATGLGVLGLLGWRRKRKQVA